MSAGYDDTVAGPSYEPIITRAAEALVGENGARMVTETRARTIIARAVHEARTRDLADAGADLYGSDEAAVELGITRRRVVALGPAAALRIHREPHVAPA